MKNIFERSENSNLYLVWCYMRDFNTLHKNSGLQAELGVYNQGRNMKKLRDIVLSAIVPDKRYVFVKILSREMYEYSERRL